MPIPLNTNSVIVPADVSSAIRDLTAACRVWPSPLSFHGGPNGGPVFLPPDVGHANEICRHILDPQQLDHWLYALSAFALVGFISMPMWLLRTYRWVRSWASQIMQFVNRGHREPQENIHTEPKGQTKPSGIKSTDTWQLGFLPVAMAGLLAILSFGLEYRQHLNLAVGLVGAAGVSSILASTLLQRKVSGLTTAIFAIFGLLAGITIQFVLHLLFVGLLGPHQ
jgi:hypothetical protein